MQWLIGVDEAGRGPLAGPVAVGAFAMPIDTPQGILAGIRDSKKLSKKQREAWYVELSSVPEARYAVCYASARTIDARGIVWAVRQALARALDALSCDPLTSTVVLDGGLMAPPEYRRQTTIIRGDATEPVISAAAILAKVRRDRLMEKLGSRYPDYGFEHHKGYGTAEHRRRIRLYGLSSEHRVTFCASSIHREE